MSVLEKKPLFYLLVESNNVESFVNLNGVKVHQVNSLMGQSKAEVPVNNYMHPEKNTLSLGLFAPETGSEYPKSARLSVSLVVKPDEDLSVSHKITDIVFDGSETDLVALNGGSGSRQVDPENDFIESSRGNVVIHPLDIEQPEEEMAGPTLTRRVDIPNSLPLWKFFVSDELPDYFAVSDETYYRDRDELYNEYEKIEKALIEGDIDVIMTMFEERNSETDRAFYLQDGTTAEELRASLKKSLSNPDLKLVRSGNEKFGLIHEPNGKLVSLVRSDDGPAIAFNFVDEPGSVRYSLVFRRENGEWILAR
ncbi:hypothetical protein OOT55_16180 [Marinimicrobium sp. C6131]|uniref:hypothetical protein n=1 Tax=Marinimicrobium sp. C6131 TaxID=3022676 RepID=UPI00223E3352|nr:hypothetical protein [Marinimicrobium sp. C6131]UZJ44178.1 hypothetical protein OOT55_16180 [Marinimicrobium sp. C6131]